MFRFLFCLLFILSATADAYLIKEIQEEGKVLVLDDGSEWDIKYFGGAWRLIGFGWIEQKEVSHWTIGDPIRVEYPDTGNLTDFLINLHNLSNNQQAFVTLRKAPSIDYTPTLWVVDCVEIHEVNGKHTHEVKLNDGTIWRITSRDMYGVVFYHTANPQMNWQLGDILTVVYAPKTLVTAGCYLLWNHQTNQMPYGDQVQIINPPLPKKRYKDHCSLR